jgi:hypothetical protein
VGDELVHFLERPRIEQEPDALARRELAGCVVAIETLLTAAELRAPFQVGEGFVWFSQAFTACDFSQSFRNFSSPLLVSG